MRWMKSLFQQWKFTYLMSGSTPDGDMNVFTAAMSPDPDLVKLPSAELLSMLNRSYNEDSLNYDECDNDEQAVEVERAHARRWTSIAGAFLASVKPIELAGFATYCDMMDVILPAASMTKGEEQDFRVAAHADALSNISGEFPKDRHSDIAAGEARSRLWREQQRRQTLALTAVADLMDRLMEDDRLTKGWSGVIDMEMDDEKYPQEEPQSSGARLIANDVIGHAGTMLVEWLGITDQARTEVIVAALAETLGDVAAAIDEI